MPFRVSEYGFLIQIMKVPHSLLLILFVTALSYSTAAQSDRLLIVPKKTVYKRTGREVPDWKRTFEVRTPIIKTKLAPVTRKQIERNLDYWRLFDMSLRDNLQGDHWLSSCDYSIKYNRHHILDIWLTIEGTGAYPDAATKYIVLDIRNGKKLGLSDVFAQTKLSGLLNKIRLKMRESEAALDKELKEVLDIHRENEIQREFHPDPSALELKNLDGFSIGDKGVTFIYDYGYAHVSEALEPPGEFFLTYAELKPFIRRDGLLARFVR